MPAITVIKLRRGTAAEWTAANPVLAAGEEGHETDTGSRKVGNGSTAWTSLGYFSPVAPGSYVQVFDARRYHATGIIGVSAVNDTAAIQAAVDAAIAAGGGEVLISGPGTWLGKRQTTAAGLTPGTGGPEWCVNIPTPSNITVRVAQGATFKLADGELSGDRICNLIRMGDGSSVATFENAHVVGPGTLDGNRANNPTTGDINWGALVLMWGRGSDCSVGHDEMTLIHGPCGAVNAFGIINTVTPDTHRGVRYDFSGAHIEDCHEGIVTIDVDRPSFHHLSFKDIVTQDIIEPVNGRHVSIHEIDIDGCPQGIDVFSGVEDFDIYSIRMKDCYGIQIGAGGSQPVRDGRIRNIYGEGATDLVWVMASGNGGTHDITVSDVEGKDCSGSVVKVENDNGQPMSGIIVRPVKSLGTTPSPVLVTGSTVANTAIATAATAVDSNEGLTIDPTAPPVAQTNFNTINVDPASAYGQYLASTGALNASVTWAVSCEAGTYLFRLTHLVNVNAGIYNLYIDGVLKGTADSHRATGLAYGVVSHIPNVAMTKGRHTIELRMATKNVAAANYQALLESVTFWKVA